MDTSVLVDRHAGGRDVATASSESRLGRLDQRRGGAVAHVAVRRDADPRLAMRLDGAATDLAVTLGEVDVAERQQRAGHVDGEKQR